jgi:hypothetical protein
VEERALDRRQGGQAVAEIAEQGAAPVVGDRPGRGVGHRGLGGGQGGDVVAAGGGDLALDDPRRGVTGGAQDGLVDRMIGAGQDRGVVALAQEVARDLEPLVHGVVDAGVVHAVARARA